MSTSDTSRFLVAVALSSVLLVVADAALGMFAEHHFLPARKLQESLSSGAVDALIVGDSRMVAALDVGEFEQGWRECAGTTPRVADLSLGGVDIAGQAIAFREFLERGGSTKLVVLGVVPESLASEPTDPDAWIGNEAVVLWWSRASDAHVYFRSSSSDLNPRTLDALFRFLVYRTSSLGSLRSLLWARAQGFQDTLLGQNLEVAENRFGRESDMRALGKRFIERALQTSRSDSASWRLSPWSCQLRRQADLHRAQLMVVELPMPSAYAPVRGSRLGKALRKGLPSDFCGRPVEWLDLSSPSGLTDERFSDGLHLDHRGAALVSKHIGCRASVILTANPAGPP
jgi:hypothetical protein